MAAIGYKELISPSIEVIVERYVLSEGMEIECYSSQEKQSDWCSIRMSASLDGQVELSGGEKGEVLLGYGEDYDSLLSGTVSIKNNRELFIRDDILKLKNTSIKDTFLECRPQDILKYILQAAGITTFQLPSADYGTMEKVVINVQSGVEAIQEVNSCWKLDNLFFFQNGVFYWGCKPEQEEIYTLEENNTILSLERFGKMWQIESFGIPWIHHSQEILVSHSKYSGIVEVTEVLVKTDEKGRTRMYLSFRG